MGVFNKFSVDGGTTFQEVEDENGRKMLAPIETDATSASKAYAVGEFLSLESTGKLYKVTAAIASGSAIVTSGSGANVTEDTVGGEIKSIKETYTTKDLLTDTVGWTGKNLFENTAESTTAAGITFTKNNDGSVTVNGTASGANPYFLIGKFDFDGEYIVSGCPSGGSSGTYQLGVAKSDMSSYVGVDYGDEVLINSSEKQTNVGILIRNGQTVSNLTFYPMIRRATEPAGYEPYHDSVKETLRNAEVIEGKNLIPIPYLTNQRSHRGINFVENIDGSVGFSGTPNDVLAFYVLNIIKLKADTYVLSDGNTTVYGGMWAGFYDDANCTVKYSGTSTGLIVDGYSASISTTQNGTINVSNSNQWGYSKEFTIGQDCYVQFCARAGNQNYYSTNQSETIYPMLCTKEEWDKSHEYEPYYEPLKDRKLDIVDQQVLGAWNLAENNGTTQTIYGATFTKNADDTVTVNVAESAVTATTKYILSSTTDVYVPLPDRLKPGGTYYLSGCTGGNYSGTDDGSDTFFLWVNFRDANNQYLGNAICSKTENAFTVPVNATQYQMGINIYAGAGKLTNKVFSPMISLKPNMPYVPLVMTNKELTDANAALNNEIIALSKKDTYKVQFANSNPSGVIFGNLVRHDSFLLFWHINSFGSTGIMWLSWRYDDVAYIKDVVGTGSQIFAASFSGSNGIKLRTTQAAGGCQMFAIPTNAGKLYRFTQDNT